MCDSSSMLCLYSHPKATIQNLRAPINFFLVMAPPVASIVSCFVLRQIQLANVHMATSWIVSSSARKKVVTMAGIIEITHWLAAACQTWTSTQKTI